jgi:hypothetical protein
MYNAPPPNLMQGIQLTESGRKTEALPYLRYAVQNERVTAEGWLWLAAATGDLEEYRYCVEQALLLDPFHPVAQRMRHDLDRHALGLVSAYPAAELQARRENTAAIRRPSRLRRLLRAVVVLVLIGGCVGGAAALIVSGVIQSAVDDWLNSSHAHTLEFTVGDQPGYRFRVEVPDSWLPADKDNVSWRDRRDALMAVFPDHSNVWEQVETSFSRAVRDPVYGDVLPPVRLVETDEDRLRASGLIGMLTLQKIVPYPTAPADASAPEDACTQMRKVEQAFKANGGLAAQPDSAVVETMLAARKALGDCIYVIHRRYTNQTQLPFPLDPALTATREILVAVPVGAERYALWQVTLPDATYDDDYAHAVERILATLAYQAPS